MMRNALVLAAAAAGASAATWYGIAPDDTITGQINLFTMAPNGQILNGKASVITGDREYPKTNTLHCSWNSSMCFFLTGVGAPYTQDAVYGVNRATGATAFKHELPAGIYVGNLAYSWTQDILYGVAFDPARRTAQIASWETKNGTYAPVLDITADIGTGFVLDGTVAIEPQTNMLYVGLQDREPAPDFILAYDLKARKLVSRQFLAWPVPSGLRAVQDPRNASNTLLLAADLSSPAIDREFVQLVSINENTRFGLEFPYSVNYLPTFSARGQVPLFLSGVMAEHAGTFLVPILPPLPGGGPNPAPGPVPIPYGLLLSVEFNPAQPGPALSQLSPIDYFLAGASGVPGV